LVTQNEKEIWGMHLTEPHTTGCVTMMLEYGTGSI